MYTRGTFWTIVIHKWEIESCSLLQGRVAGLGNYIFMEGCNKDEKYINMAEKANKNHAKILRNSRGKQ